MKIAITGHSAGIGAAFARRFTLDGHDIVGISKRDGHNIRVIPKIVPLITPCDLWINNAQAGYSQTELLYKIWQAWQGDHQKTIWLISTMLATAKTPPDLAGMTKMQVAEYQNQKQSLEEAFYQLKSLESFPRMVLIRPGVVATQPGQVPDRDGACVDKWTGTIVDCYYLALKNNLWIEEISLGFSQHRAIPIHKRII